MTYDTINDAMTMQPGAVETLLANRYRIVRQLGAGGMGSVWLAEDTQLDNKQFAIKMLPSVLISNKRAYNQLKSEALVTMKLAHPNIVTLRAFEENNGNPFLVMDYIDGQTLDDCLEDWGTLTPDQTATLLRPVAVALDYAHKQGVIHRDIKPGNIMVRKDGVPFILDFGIAREMQETMTRVTGKLSSGTLLYMSPEQLMGAQPKSAQDVYSFAAMAYECIKGEPPFLHGQIEFQILNKDPDPLSGDDAISTSIMCGLAKKPEMRPATCAAVLSGGQAPRRRDGNARNAGMSSGVSRYRTAEGAAEDGIVRWKVLAVAISAILLVAGGLCFVVNGLHTSAKDQPPEAVGPVAPPIEKDDAEAEALLSKTWFTAMVANETLKLVSCDDDSPSSMDKDNLIKEFSDAKTFYDKKLWGKAAVACTNFINKCDKFMALCKDREEAQSSRKKAEHAKSDAEQAEAIKYAADLWRNAEETLGYAAKSFGRRSFAEAKDKFDCASNMFSDAASAAIKEKRQENLRIAAKNSREQAQLALDAARKSEAESFAVQGWNEAQARMKAGDAKLRCGEYANASQDYTEAKKKFDEAAKNAEA